MWAAKRQDTHDTLISFMKQERLTVPFISILHQFYFILRKADSTDYQQSVCQCKGNKCPRVYLISLLPHAVAVELVRVVAINTVSAI